MIGKLFSRFQRPYPESKLPRLTVAQRVIDKIVSNALIYRTETGEALIGLRVHIPGRPEPDLYVLDTIPPDDSAERGAAHFVQGDYYQQDVFNWLHDNWEHIREQRRSIYSTAEGAKWDVPLAFLGNWHKHPGTLVKPSWGDTSTARDDIRDPETGVPQVLVMLATIWSHYEQPPVTSIPSPVAQPAEVLAPEAPLAEPPSDAAEAARDRDELDEELETDYLDEGTPYPILVKVSDVTTVRIDCWYMSRHIRRFTRVRPMVVPDNELPALPPVGWHLTQAERLRDEVQAFQHRRYFVQVDQIDTDRVPPDEICFTVARVDGQFALIVITQADYPATMPSIRVAPMSAMKDLPEDGKVLNHLWKVAQPLPQRSYPTWAWSPEHRLIDLVRDVEARLEAEASQANAQHEQKEKREHDEHQPGSP